MHRIRSVASSSVGLFCVGLAVACSGSDEQSPDPENEIVCPAGDVVDTDGECVLDPFRFEPEEQADQFNVVFNGEMLAHDAELPLELLTDLPPPPKSGFRLVMEPQDIPPGYDSESGDTSGFADVSPCNSWPIPDVENRWVYTAKIHTTPGLHHANLYGMEIDAEAGAQPYPRCRQSADALVFGQISRLLTGADPSELFTPAVLFASSTQVIGVDAERYALANGYAYELPVGLEVATSTHLQNTTPDTLHTEAAWDFFTMPVDQVTDPAAMFVYIHFGFMIPARSSKVVHGNCGWGGGDVLAIMPHTHQWATQFTTNFGTAPGPMPGTIAPEIDMFETMLTPYDRAGTGLTDSDVEVYSPVIETPGMDAVQFQCHFNNTTDHSMRFGVGENEMCFLFGYTSPPEAQRVGIMVNEDGGCLTLAPNEYQ